MKTLHGKLFLLGAAILALNFITGCAITQDHIRLAYVPQQNVSRVAGAENVPVQALVTDDRKITDKVSCKKNGYGMEMAAIIADDNVPYVVRSAIELELDSRGFPIKTNGIPILVSLSKFYSDFKIGFWAGTAEAEVTMEVQIKDAKGTIIFNKLLTGEGTEQNCQICSGTNAKLSLDAALQDAMRRLFSDKAFIDALFKAAKSQ
jgi:uncharacterized lipoprotein